MARVVYLTWDGPGARYLRSLYFPIFARLPFEVRVVQVSYGEEEELQRTRELAARMGLDFEGVGFRRRDSTVATVRDGAGLLLSHAMHAVWGRADMVVARSLMPAAAVLAAGVPRSRFVFDADGLVADERVEFAGWRPDGTPYRAARLVERLASRRATVTLTRTRAARDVLSRREPSARIVVAPNGSDPEAFRSTASERAAWRAERGFQADELVVVYCGTLGPQYRPDLMLAFVQELRRCVAQRVHFRIVSPSPQASELAAAASDASHVSVSPHEVRAELGAADLALAFREPSFSQCAVAPIKVGEYLLAGLPVVANRGVGDLAEGLSDEVAIVPPALTPEGVRVAARVAATRRFDREAVVQAGVDRFGLNVAVAGYTKGLCLALGKA